ncbi:MAG: hypothetical protein Q9216_004429 [Gyalolechia sp. 2 TL-2023]
MKATWLLAAMLSVEAILAVPYHGLEPAQGKELIARMGGSGGKSQGGHRSGGGKKGQPPMPGTKDHGKKNPDAKALSKSETDKLRKTLPPLDRPIRIQIVQTKPRAGETAIHEERRSDGTKRYTAYMGDNMHDHTSGMMYREKQFGDASRNAEYRPATDAEKAGKRKQTLQGANPDTRDSQGNKGGTVNEEKPPASVHPIPVNLNKIGGEIPPPTVIKGTAEVSSKLDGQLVKKIVDKCKEAGTGSTMRFQANPSPGFRASPPPVFPVKGPSSDAYKQYTLDQRDIFESSRSGQKGSSGRLRSRRSTPFAQAASEQSDANSGNSDTSTDPEKDAQRWMEAYTAVQSNATAMLMPIIEEMVNGSSSDLVWDAAWEIMSLADRTIIFLGGPVFQGMHSLDWWEDSIADKADNETMNSVLAVDAIFIDLYQSTWNKANDALKSSGLSETMDLLELALNGTSLEFDDSNADAINDFFLEGPNSTLASAPAKNVTIDAVDSASLPASIATLSDGTQTTLPANVPTQSGTLIETATSQPSDPGTLIETATTQPSGSGTLSETVTTQPSSSLAPSGTNIPSSSNVSAEGQPSATG